jgi:hypothetical protein
MRTYARADRFHWPAVVQAYREGRTFATNGPLLLFSANNAQPGDVISLEPGAFVNCDVEASSHWGVDGVTLWYNGAAVRNWATPSGSAIRGRHKLKISRSGWILATARGPVARDLVPQPEGTSRAGGQLAMTSPVYVEVSGRPLLPDKDAAEYFIRWIDAARHGFDAACTQAAARGSALSPALREQALRRIARARSVFEGKAR